MIFFESFSGVADGGDDFSFEILLSVYVVVEFVGDGIVEDAVDGEVATEGVFFCGGEHDGFGMSAV